MTVFFPWSIAVPLTAMASFTFPTIHVNNLSYIACRRKQSFYNQKSFLKHLTKLWSCFLLSPKSCQLNHIFYLIKITTKLIMLKLNTNQRQFCRNSQMPWKNDSEMCVCVMDNKTVADTAACHKTSFNGTYRFHLWNCLNNLLAKRKAHRKMQEDQ